MHIRSLGGDSAHVVLVDNHKEGVTARVEESIRGIDDNNAREMTISLVKS